MNNDSARSVDIVFQGGVRQDLESKTAPPGTLVNCDNLEFDKLNRLVRRDGFAPIGTTRQSKTNALAFPVRRFAEGPQGERLIFTDDNTHVYFPSTDKTAEASLSGKKSALRASLVGVTGIVSGTPLAIDCAGLGNYVVYAYLMFDAVNTGAVDVFIDVVEVATGNRVVTAFNAGATLFTPIVSPRVVVSTGSSVVFVVAPTSATEYSYSKIDLSAPIIAPTALAVFISDGETVGPPVFDVSPLVSGWGIVYGSFAATHKATLHFYDANPAQIVTTTWAPVGAWTPSVLALLGDDHGARVYAAGYDPATTAIRVITFAAGLSAPVQGNTSPGLPSSATQMALGRRDNGSATLAFSAYTHAVSTDPMGHIYNYAVTDAAALTDAHTFANYTIGSRFYRDARNGGLFLVGRFEDPSGFQNHLLLLDFGYADGADGWGYPVPVLHFASGRLDFTALSTNGSLLPSGIADLGGYKPGLFQFSAILQDGLSFYAPKYASAPLDRRAQASAYSFQSLSAQRFLSTPCQGVAVMSGGTPLAYDGQRLAELSFYSYPVCGPSNFVTSTIGGSMPQGVFRYKLVYEWTDAVGNRHQSPPSPEVTVDMSAGGFSGGTNQVVFLSAPLHATRKQVAFSPGATSPDQLAPVSVVAYRTTSTGQTFYRVASSGTNDSTVLVPTPGLGGFVLGGADDASDAAIATGEVLYSGPGGKGLLATTAPPPTLFLTTHQQRLCGVDGENPERIWFTRVLSQLEAPAYSPALQVLIPGAGKINGLGSQDGNLYALATNGIYLASSGDGPSDTGVGAFPSPQLVTTSASCDDPRGVLVGEDGIYFTGRDQWGPGIYLIRRGSGEPVAIGRRVRDELAAYPVCRGVVARVSKARTEFLFVDSDAAPAFGVLLYYYHDYLDQEGIGQWTVTRLSGAPECLGDWDDVSVVANAAAIGIQDGTTTRDFGSSDPTIAITTADLRPFGLVGYGQITGMTLLGTKGTYDAVTIEASYDSGQTWADRFVASVSDEGVGDPIFRRLEGATQKLPDGGSIRLRITDSAFGESGAGTTYFHGIAIETVPLGGNARLPNQKRA